MSSRRRVRNGEFARRSGSALDPQFAKALEFHKAGADVDAAAMAERLLRRKPRHALAHNLLAVLALKNGNLEAALRHAKRAVKLEPDAAVFANTRGEVRRRLGDLDGAEKDFRTAVEKDEEFAVAHSNLGLVMYARRAYVDAKAAFETALGLDPRFAECWCNLSSVHRSLGDFQAAVKSANQAVSIAPTLVEGWINLGSALLKSGSLQPSARALSRALELRPNDPTALCNLGLLRIEEQCPAEAVEVLELAARLAPKNAIAWNSLGSAWTHLGEPARAVEAYRKALEIDPDYLQAQSNLLLGLNYDPNAVPREIFEETRKWANRFEGEHSLAARSPMPGVRNGSLRIGFVSPDFRDHAVMRFFLPVLAALSEVDVCVVLYADISRPDRYTEKIRSLANVWRNVTQSTDRAVARQVQDDRIDVLVDLAGHTGGSRLGVFCQRPSAIQVTWLGYPNTTGLRSIDARITDHWVDPPGESDLLHTESLVRLPSGFICFGEPDLSPSTSSPPADLNGFVTFGSFNNLAKINKDTLQLWARILSCIPDAKLQVKERNLDTHSNRSAFTKRFIASGGNPDALKFVGRVDSAYEHLAAIGNVDVALDPMPYNGTTTTCETLWMGVPVLSIWGDRHSARVSGSIMARAGLSEWVASTEDQLVEHAIRLAQERATLASLRRSLRQCMRNSSVMDSIQFRNELLHALEGLLRGGREHY